ncbi:MAG: glycoside hydrolase family 172 protein [Bythopirellula sp.]
MIWKAVLFVGLFALAAAPLFAQPITFESLLQEQADYDTLARLPDPAYQQLQSSSYNRLSTSRDQPEQGTNGWFADSDGVSWLREEVVNGETEWVIMEHDGPGCLTKFWTPFFYYGFNNRVGPKIRIYLDGEKEPVIDEYFIELLTRNDWPESYGPRPPKQNSFDAPSPFADFTARAGNLYLPIPFAESCKVTLSSKAFYNIVNYRAYPKGTKVTSFSPDQLRKSTQLVEQSANKLLCPIESNGTQEFEAAGNLQPGEQVDVSLNQGNSVVRHLELHIDPEVVAKNPQVLRSTVLKIKFDGDETVWCPIGDFFGSPNTLNPMHTWYRTVTVEGRMSCRWVMPYRETAVVSVQNLGGESVSGKLVVRTDDWQWDDRSMHFFARWRDDHVQPGDKFVDWNFVDIRGTGVLVADTWTVLNLTRGWWGEGDEKIYVDDAYDVRKFPDHFGTGTEDYYGWAGGVNPTREDVFSQPFLANASVGSTDESNTRGFNVCVRARSLDAIPFRERLVFDMEASPGTGQRNRWNLLGYSAVSVFYALPGATTNRPPLVEAATKPIMSLEGLTAQSEKLRTVQTKRIAGAIELERYKPSIKSGDCSAGAQTPASSFRPNEVLSDGRHLFIAFERPGDAIEVTITEQFTPKRLQLSVSKCYDFGIVDVFVNGKQVAHSVDLHSETLSVEKVDLGVVNPVKNAFVIEVKLKSKNPRSRGSKTFAGLDCLELEEAS